MKKILLTLSLISAFSCRAKKTDFKPVFFDNERVSGQSEISNKVIKTWGERLDTLMRSYLEYKEIPGKVKTRILKVHGTDYSALVLMTFDSSEKLIDQYEIAGGESNPEELWEDENGVWKFGTRKKAIMTGDTEFIIREINEHSKEAVSHEKMSKDSIEWKIKIEDSGKIIEKERHSL